MATDVHARSLLSSRKDHAPEGMRSVQMLVHTSSKVKDHAVDYAMIESALQPIRDGIELALRRRRAG